MIGSYYVSAIGTAHQEKKDGVCQDHSAVRYISDSMVAAVIADGLGSAQRSDEGAKIAVTSVIEYISQKIDGMPAEQYTELIKRSFMCAYNATLAQAKEKQIDARQYNTTLTAAIYDGSGLYYGQCGDGGIIVLTVQGDYVRATQAEKGESFNETHPLLNGEKYWSFGKFDGQVCAFTMMTDGIFDLVCSPLLKDQKQQIYIPFIRRFMDRNILIANNEQDFEALQKKISEYISSEKFSANYNISDDKTLVGVINTDIMPALKPDEYYAEPDWRSLHTSMSRKIYAPVDKDPPPEDDSIAPVNTDSSSKTNETTDDGTPSKYQRQKIIELESALAHERERIQNKDKRLMIFGGVIIAQLLLIIILSVVLITKTGDNKDINSAVSSKPKATAATTKKGETASSEPMATKKSETVSDQSSSSAADTTAETSTGDDSSTTTSDTTAATSTGDDSSTTTSDAAD
jgi:serine/threonine protein phosphatase PrpC